MFLLSRDARGQLPHHKKGFELIPLLNSAIFLTQMEIEILICKPFLENQIGTHIYFIRFGSHYCHSRGSFYVA